jgi:hypothetical protein
LPIVPDPVPVRISEEGLGVLEVVLGVVYYSESLQLRMAGVMQPVRFLVHGRWFDVRIASRISELGVHEKNCTVAVRPSPATSQEKDAQSPRPEPQAPSQEAFTKHD